MDLRLAEDLPLTGAIDQDAAADRLPKKGVSEHLDVPGRSQVVAGVPSRSGARPRPVSLRS
jgi:hypothetical protein